MFAANEFCGHNTAKETDSQSLPLPLKFLMGRVWVATVSPRRGHLTAVLRDAGSEESPAPLNRSPSMIGRELRRNLVKGADSAHEEDKL